MSTVEDRSAVRPTKVFISLVPRAVLFTRFIFVLKEKKGKKKDLGRIGE